MNRKLLAGVAAGAVAAAGAAWAAMSGQLTIVSWGGAYSASQNNAYHQPYMAANPGVSIINDDSSAEAVAKLRAMAEAGNITWDIVDVVAADSMRLCDEGLAMEIDFDEWLAPAPDGTPATQDFGEFLVDKCFIPQIVYSTTFGYRTDVAAWGGKVPTSTCDVFDLANFPGKRSLEKRPIANMEWALLCDGVPMAEVYDLLETEEGVARAFAKLDTIKAETIWWTAGAETPQRLADGEVVMGSTYNGRLFAVIEEQKAPIAMMWEYQMLDLDGWIIPAGVDEAKLPLIKDYIRFATDTQRLADQAKFISYSPARASSLPLVSTHATLGIDMKPHMPTAPENMKGAFLFNYTWWADNRDDLDAKFNAWLAQ